MISVTHHFSVVIKERDLKEVYFLERKKTKNVVVEESTNEDDLKLKVEAGTTEGSPSNGKPYDDNEKSDDQNRVHLKQEPGVAESPVLKSDLYNDKESGLSISSLGSFIEDSLAKSNKSQKLVSQKIVPKRIPNIVAATLRVLKREKVRERKRQTTVMTLMQMKKSQR